MNIFYKISIDHVNANYISGWCFNRINADEIIELQCFSADNLVATVQADRFREDLKSLGVLAAIKRFSPLKLSEWVGQMKSVEAAFMENIQTRYFLKGNPARVTNGDLQEALRNSSKIRLIGTTEEYDDFVERFGRLNSISIPAKGDR